MPRTRSRRSTGRSSREPREARLDVYLFPAVVGGGLGDIMEVLDAGRILSDDGFPVWLLRLPGRPLLPSLEGPWEWPHRLRRIRRIEASASRALTITPCWGVSAAPARRERLGRAGPWSAEAAAVERAYGPNHTVHVSLEEFARTLTSREENRERFREGGTSAAAMARQTRGSLGRRDRRTWATAFRKFRALDRRNLLHLLGTFEPSPRFAREFPEIIQVGPLWPKLGIADRHATRPNGQRSVVWYASPASSMAVAADIRRGLELAGRPVRMLVRTPRPFDLPSTDRVEVEFERPLGGDAWRRAFASAALRLVTGSRTLLEAIQVGGPFLYFNGVLGRGRRRHRPEKIVALLRFWRHRGVDPTILRDLDSFSRGVRLASIVSRALGDPRWRRRFPANPHRTVARAGAVDLGTFLRRAAREFGRGAESSEEFVARL
ncbi:MAG TPA: hypothetical protein VGS18_05030, partial [Thermoplasmata archaeon]|nr:hypothetical protein [Thermoplasmata archaeon]